MPKEKTMQMTDTMESMAGTVKDGATALAERFKRDPVRIAAPIVMAALAVTTALAFGYRMVAAKAEKSAKPGRARR